MSTRICVGSMPRCGTNYFLASLAYSIDPEWALRKGGSPYKRKHKFLPGEGLDHIQNGAIIGTHGPAPFGKFFDYDHYIYLYGDPVLVAHYQHTCGTGPLHNAHCGVRREADDDFLAFDVLGLKKTFMSWCFSPRPYWRVAIKYEALSIDVVIEQLSVFLGFNVKMLPWRKRDTSHDQIPPADLLRIKETYRSLITAVREMPNISIIPPVGGLSMK